LFPTWKIQLIRTTVLNVVIGSFGMHFRLSAEISFVSFAIEIEVEGPREVEGESEPMY